MNYFESSTGNEIHEIEQAKNRLQFEKEMEYEEEITREERISRAKQSAWARI